MPSSSPTRGACRPLSIVFYHNLSHCLCSVMLELKLTRERISQLLTDLKNQKRSGEQLVDALKAQQVQLQEELSAARDRLQKELDDINFRLDVQDKAISGLTGFQKKVSADLEYIRSKLLSTEHVLLELEETLKRIGTMLEAAVQRHDLQQQVQGQGCAHEYILLTPVCVLSNTKTHSRPFQRASRGSAPSLNAATTCAGLLPPKKKTRLSACKARCRLNRNSEQVLLPLLSFARASFLRMLQLFYQPRSFAGVSEYQQRLVEDKFMAEKR